MKKYLFCLFLFVTKLVIAQSVVTGIDTNYYHSSGWYSQNFALISHTHAINDINGLAVALLTFAPISHTHEINNINGLQEALSSFAPISHVHAIADVTNLQTTLNTISASVAIKQNSLPIGTTNQYYRGDQSLATLPVRVTSVTRGWGFVGNGTTITTTGTLVVDSSLLVTTAAHKKSLDSLTTAIMSSISVSGIGCDGVVQLMTKAQRNLIINPLVGYIVFQTDNIPGLRVWNGTKWIRFTETAD